MLDQAKWITPSVPVSDACPVFLFSFPGGAAKAELQITALGVYEAGLNGNRVGSFVLAPGWTAYDHRLQVQTYDLSPLLSAGDNQLRVTVGKGWFRSPMPGWVDDEEKRSRASRPCGLIAEIHLWSADGSEQILVTDESWRCTEGPVRFSEIYDGEVFDTTFVPDEPVPVSLLSWSKDILIPQEGEEVRETERVRAKSVFRTPNGDLLVDFGQEVTGYVEISLTARAGDRVRIQHGEVLDRDGNFYNDNYRSAKAEFTCVCAEGAQTLHPRLTFFGFRYLRLAEFPGEATADQFTAIVLSSVLRRTGHLRSGLPELNQLFSNIFWGQRGNFLDVPTDCPQRDERLGWTGDAQVFAKTASYNFDVEKFFRKWLRDLRADQRPSGEVGQVIPDYMPDAPSSAAWGDAAVIIPWQMYQTYGNPSVLEEQFDSMAAWVDFITSSTTTPFLWTGHFHFGDWLALDAPSGSYTGSTRKDFIGSAFYIHSTRLLILAGHVIGRDVSKYEEALPKMLSAFRAAFPSYETQTEHVLAIQFGISEDPQKTCDALAEMIRNDGCQMRTGFVGTPYLLHVLSRFGHADVAWDLLLRREYPSWLYPISKGATTIWEHWDGIMRNGSFWSRNMNSFNHYAYGSVADWVYEQAAGITPLEPGFARVRVAPHVCPRLGSLEASIQTHHGLISSSWVCAPEGTRYEITSEMPVEIVLDGKAYSLPAGSYTFWSK